MSDEPVTRSFDLIDGPVTVRFDHYQTCPSCGRSLSAACFAVGEDEKSDGLLYQYEEWTCDGCGRVVDDWDDDFVSPQEPAPE